VAKALGGVDKHSQQTELNRESVYRMLSEHGNPRLSSLGVILAQLGIRIRFEPACDEKRVA